MISLPPRLLSLLYLVCLANTVQADKQATHIHDDALQDHAAHGSMPAVKSVVLVGLLSGGLALSLLLRLIRRRIRAGNVSDRQTPSRERAILLGAMFGFPAGLWIYDKLCPCLEKPPVSDAS